MTINDIVHFECDGMEIVSADDIDTPMPYWGYDSSMKVVYMFNVKTDKQIREFITEVKNTYG